MRLSIPVMICLGLVLSTGSFLILVLAPVTAPGWNLGFTPDRRFIQECKVYGYANSLIRKGVDALCSEVMKGTPYRRGGGHGSKVGPTNGSFDCTGLSRYYYYKATGRDPFGNTTADGQYNSKSKYVRKRIPTQKGIKALKVGDLVFFGTSAFKGHVAVYIGEGKMVEEDQRTPGKKASVSFIKGRNYAGALRMHY